MGRFMTLAESEAYNRRRRRMKELRRQIPNRPAAVVNTYPYRSLNSEKHEIRLLKIGSPPTIDKVMNFSLIHLSPDSNDGLAIGQKLHYEALSYTWSDRFGRANIGTTILIDGHKVAVTSNLASALKEIFHHDKKKLIWADAVCINQADISERNHQVSKMKLVYEKATRVITWLGEEYDCSEDAFKFFHSVLKRGVPKTMSESWVPWRSSIHIQREARAVMKLFARDYWRRIWVLQELKFAKDVMFCVGSETIEWRELEQVQELCWRHSAVIIDVLGSTDLGHMCARLWQDGPNIVDVGQDSETTNARKVGEMLVKHRRKDATDPRDKVFAILALCNWPTKERIAVDYGLDTSTVFVEATRFVIEQEQDLLILTDNKDYDTVERMSLGRPFHAPPSDRPREDSFYSFQTDSDPDLTSITLDLPSWVPNFGLPPIRQKSRISDWCQYSSLPTNETLLPGSTSKGASERGAALYVSAAGLTKPQIAILPDSKVLSTAGVRIGTVAEASNSMPAMEPGEFKFWPIYKILKIWFSNFSKNEGFKFEGQGGFLDLVLLGGLYKGDIGKEERDVFITATLKDLKLLVRRYSETELETQFHSLLGSVEVEADPTPERYRAAEVNIFGATHRLKDRTLLVLSTPDPEFAIGPECAEIGDLIVVLSGCAIPLVLRKKESESSDAWCIVGDAYVNRFMDGKAIDEVGSGARMMETFNIL
ncbi:hypothetical protein BP5796_05670 [Coleophoma crateriformis]|uniref:Heterokaryon incompatibility domain-containing protein n=1 Tax=Coleophoma crateriformis TaxID=565419 RepID=A0A3D8S3U7_9HELO|nr:hypothetical protein BP5796_05670 [Coleophoma crateriformis]